jgi:hypothetical protein
VCTNLPVTGLGILGLESLLELGHGIRLAVLLGLGLL